MAMTVSKEYITLDEKGVAWIEGANTKVIEVVRDHIHLGSSPAEIHYQHPHLSLAQVHAALSYYYGNQARLDADMERHLLLDRATELRRVLLTYDDDLLAIASARLRSGWRDLRARTGSQDRAV